jgi:hypothetical protein
MIMTHKLVLRLVSLVALAAAVASVGFALVVTYTPRLSGLELTPGEPIRALAPKIYPVPHPVDGPRFANCETCHSSGSRFASPPHHRSFGNQTCVLCHAYPQPPAEAVIKAAPHSFGWRSALGEPAMQDFDLPDTCARLSTLELILTGRHCSVRPDGQVCVACHWAGRADAGVRLDNLEGKQDLIDRGTITGFVSERSAKPANLKRLFADWQARGYPD